MKRYTATKYLITWFWNIHKCTGFQFLFSTRIKFYAKQNFHDADKDQVQVKHTQRFEALFNYASIGILLTDADGGIIVANDFALNQFGYQFQEVICLREK